MTMYHPRDEYKLDEAKLFSRESPLPIIVRSARQIRPNFIQKDVREVREGGAGAVNVAGRGVGPQRGRRRREAGCSKDKRADMIEVLDR